MSKLTKTIYSAAMLAAMAGAALLPVTAFT
jgi:hypothetical protein